MIVDASALDGEGQPYDVVILGGGAAGLTLAAALSQANSTGTRQRVLVLEGGNDKRDKVQDVFRGEVLTPDRHGPTEHFRVRALGGSSLIWGGRCLPYDPIDFADRPWVPMPGWPIPYQSFEPWYLKAHEAAETGEFLYRPARPMVRGLDGELIETTLERFSRPTNFRRRYAELIETSPDVSVMLDAHVTGIRLAQDGASVDHVEVTAPGGRRVKVRGRDYALAAGGLESVRMLLASNDVQPDGIGNAHGWLGRCYMCHMSATLGTVTFAGPPSSILGDYERDRDGVYLRRRLWLTEKAQRELQILNLAFRTHIPDAIDPVHGDPVLSLTYLARHFVKYEYSRRLREARLAPAQHVRHLTNVATQPVRLSRFVLNWIHKRYMQDRRIPSIVLPSSQNRYPMEFHSEQAPNPDSRLTLSTERDAYGMPRLRVDWRTIPLDLATVRRAYGLLASELARTRTGTLEFPAEQELEAVVLGEGAYGGHHIGAARMSARPQDGVVDPDCRVHGVRNLFVTSAAVLPTSSQANPTLTVLALTFRLADHLRQRAERATAPAELAPA